MSTAKVSFKEINRLAIPAIFAGVVEPLISLTDVVVAGHLPQNSAQALAAVGVVGSFLSALVWVLSQTRSSTSVLVSQYLGSGRLSKIQGLLPQAFLFNFLIGLLVVVSSLLCSSLIFKTFFHLQGLTLSCCLSYFYIRIWGFPLTLLTLTAFGVFEGLQNTLWTMQISLIGGLLNAGLDFLFAYGFDWGVQGVAYASLLAQLLMFVLAWVYFFSKTDGYLFFRRRWHAEFKAWLLMSFNLFVRTIALHLAIILSNRFAVSYGTADTAAQSVLINLWLFSFSFMSGFASAGNSIAGKLLGAVDCQKIWRLGIDLNKYSVITTLAVSLLYVISYYPIGRLFTHQTVVLEKFYRVFWIVILIQPINAVAFTFDGIYKGLGKAVFLRNLLLAATFLGFIPTLYLMDSFGWKLYAIWAAFLVWMLIRMLVSMLDFRSSYSQVKP